MPKQDREHRLHITEIDSFLDEFVPTLQGNEIIALIGDLGAGKTTFTQKLGTLLSVRQNITSPTYILMQHFAGKLPNKKALQQITLYHLDLYRTKTFAEAESLGLQEFWGHPQTITVIEWADKIKKYLPKDTITVYLHS